MSTFAEFSNDCRKWTSIKFQCASTQYRALENVKNIYMNLIYESLFALLVQQIQYSSLKYIKIQYRYNIVKVKAVKTVQTES